MTHLLPTAKSPATLRENVSNSPLSGHHAVVGERVRVRASVIPSCRSSSIPKNKAGFSLLEVILALAILFGAIAVLGELGRLGMQNARLTQDLTRAQFLCQSKLAEIISGITPLETIQRAEFDSLYQDSDVPWVYSIETQQIDNGGLYMVRVTVEKNLPAAQRPASFSLVQWIANPILSITSSQTSTTSSATQNSSQ